jgi:predicted RNA-binding protein (virulence factor B family)
MLYKTDLSGPLDAGQRLDGYIREVRPDGKIDLALDPAGYRRVVPLAMQILEAVKANGGRLDFDDDSPPEAIRATFATSKKAFKQALGALLRGRRIRFDHPGISLVEDGSGRPAKEH